MQQMNFNGYFSIKKISPPKPINKTSRKKNESLYKLEAIGTTIAERVYNETSNEYENISRECDITFTDLTQNHARIITQGCDISIFGAIVFSYMVDVGYMRDTGIGIASLADPTMDQNVILARDIIEGIISQLGEEHRNNLSKIIPTERRKTIILVRPGQWALRASNDDMKQAQVAEIEINEQSY